MVLRLQILLIAVVLLLLAGMIRQVKHRKLDLRYTLSWLAFIVVLLFLSLFPQILEWVSKILGVRSQMNTLFLCGFGFALVIIYTLTAAVSRQSEEIKRLTQQVALLEKTMREQKGKKQSDSCSEEDTR